MNMKKSTLNLLKVAHKYEIKYAQSLAQEGIQQALANAAAWGPAVHGIMNFPEQLKKDNASLTFTVSKNGTSIEVSNPIVTPGDAAPNYAALPLQIKTYLEKNLELFDKNADNTNLNMKYSGGEPTELSNNGIASR